MSDFVFLFIWILTSLPLSFLLFQLYKDIKGIERTSCEFSSPDSKDFKIDDPVVYNDHGDDYFTHINGVYSWEEKLCYSLEAVEFVVWSSKLRHPTSEELEKYFRK